ncbi:MAG: T9SS type A sorting domain-containing protein [Flavobacteriales bacterium]
MGENPAQLNVPILMIDDIWEYINAMGCEPNSISDQRDLKVDIYPNPARDQWNISGITNSASWTLFDAFGNELQRNLTNGNNATIDCSQLAPGVYYTEIIVSGRKVIREKIIKQ